jgi:hypothetical protein
VGEAAGGEVTPHLEWCSICRQEREIAVRNSDGKVCYDCAGIPIADPSEGET